MTTENQDGTAPPQLPVLPGQIRDAVLSEVATLSDFVQKLTLDDWTKQSAASGWTNGQVVAHLDLALGLYNRLLDAIVAGRGAGSAWKAFGQLTKKATPFSSPVFNAINSAIPRMMSGTLSPEVLKGQFAAAARNLRERLDRVQSGDYTRPAHYMGRPWPLSFFLASVDNEMAMHRWDMDSSLHRDAHVSQEAAMVLPWFYWGATSYMFRPAESLKGSIQVSVTDPDAEMWWSLDGAQTTQGAGQVQNPTVTISGSSATFVLVLAGRISADAALRDTSITATGDANLAGAFLSAWKIV